jgi:hypothetical protein
MHHRSYLHVVAISGGWAVCCERCQTTVATTRLRDRADWLAAIHPTRCTTTTPWQVAR